MTTTTISWDIAKETMDRLATQLDPAKVYAWTPRANEQAKEVVWLDSRPSEISYPVMTDGRRVRDELITYTWKVFVSGRRTPDDTGVRLAEIHAAFDNLFADDVFLGDDLAPAVLEATLEAVTPDVFADQAGPFGTCDIVATVLTRLQ